MENIKKEGVSQAMNIESICIQNAQINIFIIIKWHSVLDDISLMNARHA